ncbi:tyrosine-type recombinase/integrase [Streptomyces ipomoeae]|uniref:Site-specific recombinase, phage integrase family n=1 Tax=Streptomyces ipomoeae 91-03 TaxID=698759 RepID=L1KKZ7_9ACTN|nr:tyrosine-type recombinase/integrase [Streptomyces ipomoeae]EKX61160.1 site-specific recombinase, phage integrase family [Streptomyces ipomoeae 91-03]MDX2696879.1 tyrosine-type recombinase/integrase [Streptomyces ipomoeae]MDX2827985.1 tyrosine-type recombinase/integrase [Streptomyces ipomoeae]MDX2846007.1 tyrosine-type recombinase/integrase [Streptomyces ipomoeae]MDX2880513.1 tyrosine-type recombinase/integrase [Streptomyces ipomoeae]
MARQRKRNPNGSGTVTLRKDGRYQAAVYVPQPDGTVKRKFAYGKTFDECDRKRRELLDRASGGIPTPTRDMTLGQWFDYWLEVVVKPNLAAESYRAYETAVRNHLRPRLGSKVMLKLGVKELRGVIQRLAEDKGAKTAKHCLRVLSASLTAAMVEDIGLTRNVAKLVHVRATTDSGKSWDAVTVLRFLAAARRYSEYYPAFLLLCLLGLRRAELCGLRWENIDLENRVLWVEKQRQRTSAGTIDVELKTATSKAPLPLPAQCIAPLRWTRMRTAWLRERAISRGKPWFEDPERHVFVTRTGRPLLAASLYLIMQRILRLSDLGKMNPKGLRKSCGTLLVHLRVHPRIIKAILRHSRIATTLDIYAEALDPDVVEAVSQLDRLLRQPARIRELEADRSVPEAA